MSECLSPTPGERPAKRADPLSAAVTSVGWSPRADPPTLPSPPGAGR